MEPMNERPEEEQPKGAPAPESKDHLEWAKEKGHVPTPGPIRHRGGSHTGPHVDVVRAHMGWHVRLGHRCTEDEYDAAVKSAYSIPIGEGLSEQAAKLEAANARAAAADKKKGGKS